MCARRCASSMRRMCACDWLVRCRCSTGTGTHSLPFCFPAMPPRRRDTSSGWAGLHPDLLRRCLEALLALADGGDGPAVVRGWCGVLCSCTHWRAVAREVRACASCWGRRGRGMPLRWLAPLPALRGPERAVPQARG